jgi:hypothetical protein
MHGEKMEQFHRLCRRQFALVVDFFETIITQMRLVRELERMDEEAQITVPELLSKLEKLMAKMSQLIMIMKAVTQLHLVITEMLLLIINNNNTYNNY